MARKQDRVVSIACAAALTGAVLPGSAWANAGFGLNDGLTDWTANAYAGEAAKAYDAGTAWTNPAGEVRLPGLFENDASVDFIDPDLNLKDGVQHFPGDVNITGPQSDHGIDAAISVGSGNVISLTPRLKVGFAATSPFASRISVSPENYVGRYQDTNSIPTNVQGIFSAAFAITPHFSIGGGPIASYLKARQSHALALNQAEAFGTNLGSTIDPSGADPVAQFRGDNYAVGYDIGALYQFNDNVRIGVNYHSAVYHKLEGFQTIFIPPQIAGAQSGLSGIALQTLRAQILNANVKFTLPGWVDTSAYWQINPQWAVFANATWTNWSIFQNTRINPEVAGAPITTNIQYNFHDTVTTGVGVNYVPRGMPRLMLQTGATFDQSPVDDSTRQVSIPDGDRVEIGLGATYKLSRLTTLNIAYAHYFFPDEMNVDNGIGNQVVTAAGIPGKVTIPSGTVTGHYDIQNNVLSVGLKTFF